jgi:glycogen debranching enzyme
MDEATRPTDRADGVDTPQVQFYIPATSSLLERRPRTLKHGDTFGVFDHYGNIAAGMRSPEGLFHRDTRYLSDLRVLINGDWPLLLSSTVQDNNAQMSADLTNPDIYDGHRLVLARDAVHVVRTKFLWQAASYERFGIRNFDAEPQHISLSIHFAADFADIFEVRGHRRQSRGEISTEVLRDGVIYIYRGLDGVMRRSVIRFEPEPVEIDGNSALFELDLAPDDLTSIFCTVACVADADGVRPDAEPRRFITCLRAARRALRASSARAASVATSSDSFDEMLRRSVADLYMLITDTPYGPYPYAGIPWFATAFGRDAIITAIETLWIDPAIARGVLRYLAATQATEVRPEADAEPGKILHETRAGEVARLGEVPFALYYGSVDSTPLFVLLAGLYFARTGDLTLMSELWPNIEAALAWIDRQEKASPEGFLTYGRARKEGLANQGWKDSQDSIFHADGSLAESPIALCEVQGYVYAARRQAAKIAAAINRPERARELETAASALQQRFEEVFWCEDIGTYALALDGRGAPCRVRSSNAGQLLFTRICAPERARRVADQLMGQASFSGWGIRTIPAGEARYNPMSYHNGSVWPHDNALIGLGFSEYGLSGHLLRLFDGIVAAASYMDLRRLPELFCGFRRVRGKGPTFYPVSCAPQAWASGVPFALLQASLGLELDATTQTVRFRQPRLPAFLDEVIIRGLTLGESRLDLLLRRYGADVSVNVLARQGDAQVAVTL